MVLALVFPFIRTEFTVILTLTDSVAALYIVPSPPSSRFASRLPQTQWTHSLYAFPILFRGIKGKHHHSTLHSLNGGLRDVTHSIQVAPGRNNRTKRRPGISSNLRDHLLTSPLSDASRRSAQNVLPIIPSVLGIPPMSNLSHYLDAPLRGPRAISHPN